MPAQPAGCSAETDVEGALDSGQDPNSRQGAQEAACRNVGKAVNPPLPTLPSEVQRPARRKVLSGALNFPRINLLQCPTAGATTRSTQQPQHHCHIADREPRRFRSEVGSFGVCSLETAWQICTLHPSLPVYFLRLKPLQVKPLRLHAGSSGCLLRRGAAEVHQRWCSSRLRRAVPTSAASR